MANVLWNPQPKQIAFMERPEYEVLYGGAAGGGKSDALLMEALRQVDNPDYRGIIFRKTFPQLSELIDRSLIFYMAAFPRAKYNDSKHVWVFPSGAKIFFASMQHSKDKTNYQGKRYDFIGFDELTHFTWEEYSYMFSRNRPSKRPKSTKKTICYIRATTNPGGVGHGWVKERFIDAAEPGQTIVEMVEVTMPDGIKRKIKRDRVFIQATIFDNQALLENDPGYLGSLALLPEKERDALLYGVWDVFEGQYFTEFRVRPDPVKCKEAGITPEQALERHQWTHVIPAFDINAGNRSGWKIYRSYDFGYAKPFSCAWWAVDYDGVMYRIMEMYGCTKIPVQQLPDQGPSAQISIFRLCQHRPAVRKLSGAGSNGPEGRIRPLPNVLPLELHNMGRRQGFPVMGSNRVHGIPDVQRSSTGVILHQIGTGQSVTVGGVHRWNWLRYAIRPDVFRLLSVILNQVCRRKNLPTRCADGMYRVTGIYPNASSGVAEGKRCNDRLTYTTGVFPSQCVDRCICIAQMSVSTVIAFYNKRLPAPDRELIHATNYPAHGVICQRPDGFYAIPIPYFLLAGKYGIPRNRPVDNLSRRAPGQQLP